MTQAKPKLIEQTGEVLFSELDNYNAHGAWFTTGESGLFRCPFEAAADCARWSNACRERGYCCCDLLLGVPVPAEALLEPVPKGKEVELHAISHSVWIRRDDLEDTDNA